MHNAQDPVLLRSSRGQHPTGHGHPEEHQQVRGVNSLLVGEVIVSIGSHQEFTFGVHDARVADFVPDLQGLVSHQMNDETRFVDPLFCIDCIIIFKPVLGNLNL